MVYPFLKQNHFANSQWQRMETTYMKTERRMQRLSIDTNLAVLQHLPKMNLSVTQNKDKLKLFAFRASAQKCPK